jgi:TrwC relaxase
MTVAKVRLAMAAMGKPKTKVGVARFFYFSKAPSWSRRRKTAWLSDHYAANDYYCEGEHVVGSWAGKGAEFFRIAGHQIEPQNEAFLRLFSGQTPEGEKLKPLCTKYSQRRGEIEKIKVP